MADIIQLPLKNYGCCFHPTMWKFHKCKGCQFYLVCEFKKKYAQK